MIFSQVRRSKPFPAPAYTCLSGFWAQACTALNLPHTSACPTPLLRTLPLITCCRRCRPIKACSNPRPNSPSRTPWWGSMWSPLTQTSRHSTYSQAINKTPRACVAIRVASYRPPLTTSTRFGLRTREPQSMSLCLARWSAHQKQCNVG